MTRRLAARVAVLVGSLGALSVACGGTDGSASESPNQTAQAERIVGTGSGTDHEILDAGNTDSGVDSGTFGGGIFTGPPRVRACTQLTLPPPPSWSAQATANADAGTSVDAGADVPACEGERYFVVGQGLEGPGSGAECASIIGRNGTWAGRPAFASGSVRSQLCHYEWSPSCSPSTPEYALLDAVIIHYEPGPSVVDHIEVFRDCEPPPSSCGPSSSGALCKGQPTVRRRHGGVGGVICDSCGTSFENNKLFVSLPAGELATRWVILVNEQEVIVERPLSRKWAQTFYVDVDATVTLTPGLSMALYKALD